MVAAVVVCLTLIGSSHANGQTFHGRAIDQTTNAPVATTLIRLISEDGNPRGFSIADAAGLYSLNAPGPGVYHVEGERLGYEVFQTSTVEVLSSEGLFPLDLLMKRSPVLIESLVVSTERTDEEIRSLIDASPDSLRYGRVQFEEILNQIGRRGDISNALRWSRSEGLVALNTTAGPCFSLQARDCEPIYLNGLHLNREFETDGLDGWYEQYYENGQLQAKGTIVDGERDGIWEEYYENGQLRTKGTHTSDELDGPYEQYYENGQLQAKGTYWGGEVDGTWEEYYEDGQLRARGTMKWGAPDGPYEQYYENNQLQTKGTIIDGEMDGVWEQYYENGQLKTQRTYKVGEHDGPYVHYDQHGRIQVRGTIIGGDRTGFWEQYDQRGQLQAKGTIMGGEVDGAWEEYDENAQLKAKGTVLDGERDGVWEEYYDSGQLQTKGS